MLFPRYGVWGSISALRNNWLYTLVNKRVKSATADVRGCRLILSDDSRFIDTVIESSFVFFEFHYCHGELGLAGWDRMDPPARRHTFQSIILHEVGVQ